MFGALQIASREDLEGAARQGHTLLRDIAITLESFGEDRNWVVADGQPTDGGSFANSSWVLDLVLQAKRESQCVKLGCTTCGAMAFQDLLAWIPTKVDADLMPRFGAKHAQIFLNEIDVLSEQGNWEGILAERAIQFIRHMCQLALHEDRRRRDPTFELECQRLEELAASRREEEAIEEQERVRIARELKRAARQEAHEARKKHYRELWLSKLAAKQPERNSNSE